MRELWTLNTRSVRDRDVRHRSAPKSRGFLLKAKSEHQVFIEASIVHTYTKSAQRANPIPYGGEGPLDKERKSDGLGALGF